jgi:hypothetical protein
MVPTMSVPDAPDAEGHVGLDVVPPPQVELPQGGQRDGGDGGDVGDCCVAVRSCSSQLAARLCAVRRLWFEVAILLVVDSR